MLFRNGRRQLQIFDQLFSNHVPPPISSALFFNSCLNAAAESAKIRACREREREKEKKNNTHKLGEGENYTFIMYLSIIFSPLACLTGMQEEEETSAEPMKVELTCEAAEASSNDGKLF